MPPLIDVAREHINYILDRIELFLDLELLTVDENGCWPELYDEQHQPTADYRPPRGARAAYGRLPREACHSWDIKRMLAVPAGRCELHGKPAATAPDPAAQPEEIPTPPPE